MTLPACNHTPAPGRRFWVDGSFLSLRLSAMNKRNLLPKNGTRAPWRFSLACFALIFCLAALATTPALAADPEDDFLTIVEKIHEGDTLNSTGKSDPALAKYKQAQAELLAFRKTWPTWNLSLIHI